jgi:hypothetical protein
MKKLGLLTVCLLMVGVGAGAEMRIWTSAKGDTIEAEYVRDAAGKVWLKPVKGKTKVVPIAALSKEDRLYIQRQTPPKIEIDVDDDISRSTVGSDIDNVREKITISVEIKKTSKAPYPTEYEVFFFAIAWDLRSEEYFLADKRIEKFVLDESNGNSFGFSGKRLQFERDPDPPWGRRYDGYLVCVKMDGGKVVATAGRDKYMKQFDVLVEGALNKTRFDERFNAL